MAKLGSALVATALSTVLFGVDGHAECVELPIAAGSRDGAYHALASDLDRALRARGAETCLAVKETAGSYENAELVRSGQVRLALLQSDVAFLEHYDGRPFVAIAGLHKEAVHVVSRLEFGWTDLDDVRGHQGSLRVSIGPPKSGSAAHGLAILDLLGLLDDRTRVLNLSKADTLAGLWQREIDLAFFTSAVPFDLLTPVLDGRIVVLQPVGGHWIRKLRKENPFFYGMEIPLGAYPNLEQKVTTLGTRTLLVGPRDVPEHVVNELLETLESEEFGLLPGSRLLPGSLDEGLRDSPIQIHSASRRYEASRQSPWSRLWLWTKPNILPVLVLVLVGLALLNFRPIVYTLYQRTLGRIVALVVLVWLAGALAMYFLENAKNAAFSSFPRASTAILLYLFSGLEAKVPVTAAGNVVAMIMLVSGAVILAFFSATLVKLVVEKAFNLKHLWIKPWLFSFKWFSFKNHVVIAGWSSRTERVLTQLRSPDIGRKPRVVVIAEKALEAEVPRRRDYRDVWVVEGKPWSSKTLHSANIEQAKTALVLTPSEGSEEERLREISTALAIEHIAPDVRTVVEASSPDLKRHSVRVLSDFQRNDQPTEAGLALDEVVETSIICERMVSQALITPGITRFYEEILAFGRDSQELYTAQVPESMVGWSFQRVQQSLVADDLVPVGIWLSQEVEAHGRKTRLVLNPGAEASLAGRALENGDHVVFVADSADVFNRAVGVASTRLDRLRIAWDGAMSAAHSLRRAVGFDRRPPAPPTCTYVPKGESAVSIEQEAVHVGICGWSRAAKGIIEQLQNEVVAERKDFRISVIVETESEKAKKESQGSIRVVTGNPTSRGDLRGAGIRRFRSLVILAERDEKGQPTGRYVDHRSLLIALAATDEKPDLHVVVEVVDSANREHFQRIPNCEIVSVEDLTERVLAQAVVTPGITKVVLRLLTASTETNEVYVVPVPENWKDRTFQDFYLGALQAEADFIPIGYEASVGEGDRELVINPYQREGRRKSGVVSHRHYRLQKEDRLVVVAYREPNLEGLVPAD